VTKFNHLLLEPILLAYRNLSIHWTLFLPESFAILGPMPPLELQNSSDPHALADSLEVTGLWSERFKPASLCQKGQLLLDFTHIGFPRLDTGLNPLAERLMLFDPKDVHAIVEAMESGVPLEQLAD
jgi:hypothetical protein